MARKHAEAFDTGDVPTLGSAVIYVEQDQIEKAAIVSRVVGDEISLSIFEPHHGGGCRFEEAVPHQSEAGELGKGSHWRWPNEK